MNPRTLVSTSYQWHACGNIPKKLTISDIGSATFFFTRRFIPLWGCNPEKFAGGLQEGVKSCFEKTSEGNHYWSQELRGCKTFHAKTAVLPGFKHIAHILAFECKKNDMNEAGSCHPVLLPFSNKAGGTWPVWSNIAFFQVVAATVMKTRTMACSHKDFFQSMGHPTLTMQISLGLGGCHF